MNTHTNPGSRAARSPQPFVVLAAVLLVSGAASWIFVLPSISPVASRPWPTAAIVGLGVVAMFVQVDVVSAGKHMTSFVMTDAAIVLAALLGRPVAVPLIVLATMAVTVVQRRPPAVKVAFNLGQELVGSLLALAVFSALRDDSVVSVRTGLAALLAGIVVGFVSAVAIGFGSRIASQGTSGAPILSLALIVAGSIGNAAVALQAIYLGSIAVPLGFVPLLPLLLIYAAYRGIRDQQHTTDRTELLYRATAALHEQPNLDDGLLQVLDQVREAMRGDSARVVLLTPDGAATCEATEDRQTGGEMTTASPAMEQAARRLAAELPGAVLVRSNTPAATRGPMSVFASEDAIVAPLVRNGEAAGVVVVVGSAGGGAQLYQSDVDLVEVLAKQIGLALERGFLEKSIRQLLELEQQLTKQAYYDTVTGLANRNYLNDEIDQFLRSGSHESRAVLLVDLDDFKTVNDSLGHVAGDRLLAVIAQRLQTCVGTHGLVTRIGGDEFAILLHDVRTESDAQEVATQIIDEVSALVNLDGREVGVGASIGVRLTSGSPDSATDILRDADLALYNAKSAGKGRFRCYEPSMHIQVQERLVLTAALANAIERDEFTLVFQPIFELSTGRFTAVEALVRWRHPERGELLPGQFLALTEETGLIVGLGGHVLRQSLDAIQQWSRFIGDEPFYVAINVSGRQLLDGGFAESVLGVIRDSGASPDRILLEITESVFIGDRDEVRDSLIALSDAGVRLGLDDFGTGYASLSQIHRFPLNQLKIDRSFVSRLDSSPDDRLLVTAIIQLAEALQMDVVAEGIETEAQLAELLRLGCRRGQGWLLGKPQTALMIERLLSDPALRSVPLTR